MEPLAAGDPRQVGTYRLRARLGAGGMGQVFLGYSPGGRAVAVKVIHRELAHDQAFRIRFRREVAAARAVSGAYTAPVTAAGPDDDPPWLATAFVPGPSLAEAVAAAGPLPRASVWRLAAGLVEALQAVHACGLVHRDLKPANVLLAIDGPRVIDFGISRALESTAMTSTGQIVGTPSFMSPEQAAGGRVGPASDVFSFGCVIVFAATGAGPFGNGPHASTLYRIVHAAPALAEVPGGLRELAAACLAKAPADRLTLPALVDAIAAGGGPDEGAELASFWPVAVTGLIRSHQARISTEMRDVPTGSRGTEQAAGPTAKPGATVRETAARGTATAYGPGELPMRSPETEAAGLGSGPAPAGLPTVLATFPAGAGESLPTSALSPGEGLPTSAVGAGARLPPGPALPADSVMGEAPGGRPVPGMIRRRVLLGLAVAAGAGLAAAGWELSQDAAPHHRASGGQPAPGTQASKPASQAGPTSSSGAQRPAALWSFTTGGMVAGIALAGGTVFAGSTDGAVYALGASDGTKLWGFRTGGPVASGIAAADGAVYLGSNDNKVYALRASDGTRLWSFPTGGSVASGIAVADGIVYAGSGDETVYALRASDGSRLWSEPIGSAREIAVAGGSVFVGIEGDTVFALRASNGGRLWEVSTGAGGTSGIAVAGSAVYVGSGDDKVHALRAGDGTQIWEFTAGGSVESGIAVAGSVVYVGSNDNMMNALRDGRSIWGFPTNGPVASGIAVADGIVYFGSNDYTVHAVHAADGTPLWDFPTGGPVDSAIAVANGIAYVGSNDAKVYALQA